MEGAGIRNLNLSHNQTALKQKQFQEAEASCHFGKQPVLEACCQKSRIPMGMVSKLKITRHDACVLNTTSYFDSWRPIPVTWNNKKKTII